MPPHDSPASCSACGAGPVIARGLCRPCYAKEWRLKPENRERERERLKRQEAERADVIRVRKQAYYLANKAKIDARNLAWAAAHPEQRRALGRRYEAANPAKRHEKNRRWRAANPDKVADMERRKYVRDAAKIRERSARRRAVHAAVWATPIDVDAIYARDGGRCGVCGKPVARNVASLDHILPLAHGGTHEARNVRITHRRCNMARRHQGPAQLRLLE